MADCSSDGRAVGAATGFATPASIFRCFIVPKDPLTSAVTSPATTGPDRPASAVNDALPRVVAVFSRNRDAFGSFGRSEMMM